jgi:hypothetical protein
VNRGDGTYADVANYAGVACSDWSWTLEITWRSGKRSVVQHVKANYLYEIDESAAPPAQPPPPPVPLFQDVSATMAHRHADPAYADFDRQLQLPAG